MYSSVKHEVSRRLDFLANNREVGFWGRLRIAGSLRPGCAAMRFLLDNRLISGPGEPHFQVSGNSVYFQPDYSISREQKLLQGISQVLVETFVFPQIFSGHVTVNEGDVVVDLGANIGTTALLFSEMVGEQGRVYAFEPIVHDICQLNVDRNQAVNVTVVPLGVSNSGGVVEFEVTDFCLDSTICPPQSPARLHDQDRQVMERRECSVVRLDDWVADAGLTRIDFIKMDIEGAEELALRGAQAVVEQFRPKWSISSYHNDFDNERQHPKLVKLLKSWGYRIEELGHQHIFAW